MTTQRYYELLDNAPEKLEPIARLFSWSENYDYPTPATLYLDLTGYSDEYIGVELCAEKRPALGYLEIGMLADALQAYAGRPLEATHYIETLLAAEYEDEEQEHEESEAN